MTADRIAFLADRHVGLQDGASFKQHIHHHPSGVHRHQALSTLTQDVQGDGDCSYSRGTMGTTMPL